MSQNTRFHPCHEPLSILGFSPSQFWQVYSVSRVQATTSIGCQESSLRKLSSFSLSQPKLAIILSVEARTKSLPTPHSVDNSASPCVDVCGVLPESPALCNGDHYPALYIPAGPQCSTNHCTVPCISHPSHTATTGPLSLIIRPKVHKQRYSSLYGPWSLVRMLGRETVFLLHTLFLRWFCQVSQNGEWSW